MCEHCGALALANEKWLCVHLPEAGIRHPKITKFQMKKEAESNGLDGRAGRARGTRDG